MTAKEILLSHNRHINIDVHPEIIDAMEEYAGQRIIEELYAYEKFLDKERSGRTFFFLVNEYLIEKYLKQRQK